MANRDTDFKLINLFFVGKHRVVACLAILYISLSFLYFPFFSTVIALVLGNIKLNYKTIVSTSFTNLL